MPLSQGSCSPAVCFQSPFATRRLIFLGLGGGFGGGGLFEDGCGELFHRGGELDDQKERRVLARHRLFFDGAGQLQGLLHGIPGLHRRVPRLSAALFYSTRAEIAFIHPEFPPTTPLRAVRVLLLWSGLVFCARPMPELSTRNG